MLYFFWLFVIVIDEKSVFNSLVLYHNLFYQPRITEDGLYCQGEVLRL